MKKIIAAILLGMSMTAMAGIVELDGRKTPTTIRVSERDNHIKFESRVPNFSMRVGKIAILRAMKTRGTADAIIEIERNGLINTNGRNVRAVLDRVGDGLWIRTATSSMFITERELENIR